MGRTHLRYALAMLAAATPNAGSPVCLDTGLTKPKHKPRKKSKKKKVWYTVDSPEVKAMSKK